MTKRSLPYIFARDSNIQVRLLGSRIRRHQRHSRLLRAYVRPERFHINYHQTDHSSSPLTGHDHDEVHASVGGFVPLF